MKDDRLYLTHIAECIEHIEDKKRRKKICLNLWNLWTKRTHYECITGWQRRA